MVVVVNAVEVDVRVDARVVGGCPGRAEGGRRRGREKEVSSGSPQLAAAWRDSCSARRKRSESWLAGMEPDAQGEFGRPRRRHGSHPKLLYLT